MALEFSINPNTAARVYQELEKEGLCETRRGLGTFVTGNRDRILALRHAMARQAVRQCRQTLRSLGVARDEAIQMMLEEDD